MWLQKVQDVDVPDGMLEVTVVEARHIPKGDYLSDSDPYVSYAQFLTCKTDCEMCTGLKQMTDLARPIPCKACDGKFHVHMGIVFATCGKCV